MKKTMEEAYEALANFETANDVANYLKTQHITGNRQDDLSCPIAEYMSKMTGSTISVGIKRMIDLDQTLDEETEEDGIALSDAIIEFIRLFDGYHFEELLNEYEDY